MAGSRRADAVLFGFDFQVNAAIVLMLENILDLKSLRLEGESEDIELKLNDNEYILAQAKAVVKSCEDFSNVRANLKKSLISLSEGAKKTNTGKLILITNSPNPLNEDLSRNIFLGNAHRDYNSLPQSSKKIIDDYLKKIEQPLDTSKFMIQILPFETDNEIERYKMIRQAVDDFVGSISLNVPGIGNKLMKIWQNDIFKNGGKKDVEIKLTKNDIIWPVIVLATDIERIDEDFIDYFDSGLYDEIIYKYKDLIETYCERCEFFIKVLSDYQAFESSKKNSEKSIDFALKKWKDYQDEFELLNADEELKEGLIKVVLYNIVKNRRVIDRIKREVRL